MNWWGNSFEGKSLAGISSYATNALKKAQKKIDRVLDIPSEEDFTVNKEISTDNIIKDANKEVDDVDDFSKDKNNNRQRAIEINQPKLDVQLESEFSDVNLNSPKNSPSAIKHLEEVTNNSKGFSGYRLGDWNNEDSLSASQFEPFQEDSSNLESFSETSNSMDILSYQYTTEEFNSVHSCEAPTPVPELPIAQEDDLHIGINRNSHLSISSDCTSCTIKRNLSDIESSGHTDDFTSLNNELTKSDSSVGNDDIVMDERRSVESPNTFTISKEENLFKEIPTTVTTVNKQCIASSPNKDEFESNTTSSDIELVSCCTSNNGDNSIPNPVISRSIVPDYMKHQRSASGSSMSICKVEYFDEQNDPDNFSHIHFYQQQIAELNNKLDVRESKLIQLSRENIDLRDTINNLTRQIEQINERQEADTTDISVLTREFTTRLNDAERRYQTANKERDQFRKIVSEYKNIESQQIEKVIKEKDEQLASLLQEGEKLAQDQLKATNTIKKIRNSLKEKDVEIANQNLKVSKLESEISHLKAVLDNKEDNEKKHIDGINQLTKAVEKLEKDNSQFNNNNEILQEKCRSFEFALNKISQENTQLHKQIAEVQAERNAQEVEYRKLINQQSNKSDIIVDFQTKVEQAEKEIELLQKKIQSQFKEFSYKEEEYNSRISYLQERLAEMQQRQEEIDEAASNATKPVLRQLEAIQNACSTHTSNWEQIEKIMNMKIMDLNQKLSISEESVETYKEQLQNRETIINSLREEKNRLLNQCNSEYANKQLLLDQKMELETNVVNIQQMFQREKDGFVLKIKELQLSLSDTHHALELEKQNVSNLNAKLLSAQMLNQRQEKSYRSRQSSGESNHSDVEPDDSVSLVSSRSVDASDKRPASSLLYDNLRQQGIAVVIEHLEASVKLKEGQISKLHREIDSLSRSREGMLEEMTQLTDTIEQLELQLKSQRDQMENVQTLTDRYNALLQMYGEKMEECDELRMDLSEVKEVYRAHIDMLSKTKECL